MESAAQHDERTLLHILRLVLVIVRRGEDVKRSSLTQINYRGGRIDHRTVVGSVTRDVDGAIRVITSKATVTPGRRTEVLKKKHSDGGRSTSPYECPPRARLSRPTIVAVSQARRVIKIGRSYMSSRAGRPRPGIACVKVGPKFPAVTAPTSKEYSDFKSPVGRRMEREGDPIVRAELVVDGRA